MSFLSFPLLPRACQSYVLICLLPFAPCSLAAAFQAAQSLNPSHISSRQAVFHKAASGKGENGLCCISSVQVGIVSYVQPWICAAFHCKQSAAVKHEYTTSLEASCRIVAGR